MKRSTFLKQSSALAALAFVPSSCRMSFSNTSFPLGLQLYTVRDFMAKDPLGTLKKLKAMGYSDFESYGLTQSIKPTTAMAPQNSRPF